MTQSKKKTKRTQHDIQKMVDYCMCEIIGSYSFAQQKTFHRLLGIEIAKGPALDKAIEEDINRPLIIHRVRKKK
jgi:hypothetical protein